MLGLKRLLRKLSTAKGTDGCSGQDESNRIPRTPTRRLNLYKKSSSAPSPLEPSQPRQPHPASQYVILDADLLKKIFSFLPHTATNVLNYALVCKFWHEVSLEVPLDIRFSQPMTPAQYYSLVSTSQTVGALTFEESESRASLLLQEPLFIAKQGQHLQKLWDIEWIDPICGTPICLQQFPNVRELFLKSSQARQNARSKFNSRTLAPLTKLETLSLRGFCQLDLRYLPLSIQFLHVSSATLVQRPLIEENATSENATTWNDRISLQPSQQNDGAPPSIKRTYNGGQAFPIGLCIEQVIIDSGRGVWLEEPLELYFQIAKQITLFARKVVVFDQPNPYGGLLAQLHRSGVRRLTLDFEHIMLCRLDQLLGVMLNRTKVEATDLVKQMRAAQIGEKFIFQSAKGVMFEQSVTASRTDNFS